MKEDREEREAAAAALVVGDVVYSVVGILTVIMLSARIFLLGGLGIAVLLLYLVLLRPIVRRRARGAAK